MLGKSHLKIGVLSGVMVATVPILNSFPLFNNQFIHVPKGINVAGVALAALGALMVDADSQHSKINHMNVATGVFNEGVGFLEKILKTIINMIFTAGLGAFILYNSSTFIKQISAISKLRPYAYYITFGVAYMLILAGIMGIRIARYIPLFGAIYVLITEAIANIAALLKRAWMFLIYVGGGICIMYYNFSHLNDPMIYLIGFLCIAIAIFPHRSFLHSIEGVILFTIAASYVLYKIGYGYLNGYFFIGYASHIYWADIFTAEGVPFSIIPMLLKRLKLKDVLMKFKAYRIIDKILNIRLRVPPHVRTGSEGGNAFEAIYVFSFLILAVLAFDKYGGVIKIL